MCVLIGVDLYFRGKVETTLARITLSGKRGTTISHVWALNIGACAMSFWSTFRTAKAYRRHVVYFTLAKFL